MAEHAAKRYVKRSRHDRRVQLAKLARDHGADMSIIVGVSWRLKGHQAHVDYTGGLDVTRIWPSLASLRNLGWGSALPRMFLPSPAIEDSTKIPELTETTQAKLVSGPESGGFPMVPSHWRDALARAAPVDLQRRLSHRQPGETAEAQQARTLAYNERKARDFAAVVARVDTAAMASLARDLLEERRRWRSSGRSTDPVPLPRIAAPFFGGGHAFYVVQFWGDGGVEKSVRWIMKIPSAGQNGGWDELCRETLRAEAFLLHKLRTETQIPVPEVIDADCRADGEIGAPWMLMEFVQGRRLEDVWFGLDIRDDVKRLAFVKERRETILRNIADAMLQLGRYEFDQGGAPFFDRADGELVGVGPLRQLDVQAMVDRWLLDEDCETTPMYRAAGPWDDTRDMYTALLDPPADVPERGIDELLRLLLSHIREPGLCQPPGFAHRESTVGRRTLPDEEKTETNMKMKKFVLTHSDLSMRHILLADDGTTIKAILGWDGARAAPRSLGNEALPRWLVRDFDPFVWRWRPAPDFWRASHVLPGRSQFEDPPWVLRELRGYYVRTVQALKTEREERAKSQERGREQAWGGVDIMKREEAHHTGNGNREGFDVDADVDITKQSLLTLTLDAAIRDPRCRTAVLRRLMGKCSRSFEELDFGLFVDTLGNGHEIDSMKLKFLANNVGELVDKGFVKGAVVW
ncbi:hypothetical protein F5Y10DRAFT_286737 [Nemania abortiva]|nr:hypothetical protein F5Y10DRAFT_286737 [Nemania abortiva]